MQEIQTSAHSVNSSSILLFFFSKRLVAWLTETKEIVITANLGAFHYHTESVIYPHKYESLVIVVKNNIYLYLFLVTVNHFVCGTSVWAAVDKLNWNYRLSHKATKMRLHVRGYCSTILWRCHSHRTAYKSPLPTCSACPRSHNHSPICWNVHNRHTLRRFYYTIQSAEYRFD